jgi:hypothetical protein
VTWTQIGIVGIEAGKIVEDRVVAEALSLRHQLGLGIA